ncbi:MAG TPA: DUF541 domain-containing protein [Chloroflexi bacterium]|nr:DUF541 domain-containing protein [Chloroflexota bacterium]
MNRLMSVKKTCFLKGETKMKNKWYLVVIGLMMVGLLISACGQKAPAAESVAPGSSNPHTVSVSGMGEVYLKPDVAYVTLGIRTQSDEAGSAVSENNSVADAIMAALQGKGIAEGDIRTSSFNVYWNDEWQGEGVPMKRSYVVENMMEVTVKDFDDLGSVLDAALGAGANSVYNVRFDVLDKTEAAKVARELAVANAMAQAQQLADAAGITLGDIMNLSTYGSGYVVDPQWGRGMGGGAMMESAADVPVSGGQLIFQVEVSIVYEIAE